MHNNDINKSDSNNDNFNESNINGSINNLTGKKLLQNKFGWKKFREIYFLKLKIDL